MLRWHWRKKLNSFKLVQLEKTSSFIASTTMFVWVFEAALITQGFFKFLGGYKFTKRHNSHEQSWKQEVCMSKWAVCGCQITWGGMCATGTLHLNTNSCLSFPHLISAFTQGFVFITWDPGYTFVAAELLSHLRIHAIWYRLASLPRSSSCPGSFGE